MVEKRGRLVAVPLAEVRWLESEGNYVRVHGAGTSYLMRATLRLLELRLDPRHFVRLHRGAIVALSQIGSVEPGTHGDGTVLLRDGTRLTVARNRARELRRRLRG